MASKYRDCAECADQHDVKDMYPYEGWYICQPCLDESFVLQEVK